MKPKAIYVSVRQKKKIFPFHIKKNLLLYLVSFHLPAMLLRITTFPCDTHIYFSINTREERREISFIPLIPLKNDSQTRKTLFFVRFCYFVVVCHSFSVRVVQRNFDLFIIVRLKRVLACKVRFFLHCFQTLQVKWKISKACLSLVFAVLFASIYISSRIIQREYKKPTD